MSKAPNGLLKLDLFSNVAPDIRITCKEAVVVDFCPYLRELPLA
ncbi:hypothetical protein [Paraburkholderia antibiotica]|nr:hypothetical protein [Paraburkholderia antibiotica]